MYFIKDDLPFPDVSLADEDGLLAIGGDLSIERLLNAYRNGIFPWYNETDPPCWWSPDPRFVLFPEELKISSSMKALLNKDVFHFSIDKDFPQVIKNCRNAFRKDQEGTWINQDIIDAYTKLYELGYAHSAEAWMDHKLAGGLYDIRMKNIFFGESMFSSISNASKFAFIKFVTQLQRENVIMIDCQVYTPHLESLGARMISRKDFISILNNNIS